MRSLARRHVLIGVGATVAAIATARSAGAQTSSPTSAGPADPALIEDLVAANRILADQGVLDGYGHVSVRHNAAPDRYLMSRSIAPELVTTADIMEYDLDSRPVDSLGRATYPERFIHGEIYRARPDVRAVVHSHSPSVIPFGVTGAPLRPLYHMSAFLTGGVPVFAPPGPGDGARRTGDLSRPGRGEARGGFGQRHHRPALGALEAEGAGQIA
jgi:Class II Aldolase and Adducin N-terminal domain